MSRRWKRHRRQAVHGVCRKTSCLLSVLQKRVVGEPEKRVLSYSYDDDR
jgi:hypothetical protein